MAVTEKLRRGPRRTTFVYRPGSDTRCNRCHDCRIGCIGHAKRRPRVFYPRCDRSRRSVNAGSLLRDRDRRGSLPSNPCARHRSRGTQGNDRSAKGWGFDRDRSGPSIPASRRRRGVLERSHCRWVRKSNLPGGWRSHRGSHHLCSTRFRLGAGNYLR